VLAAYSGPMKISATWGTALVLLASLAYASAQVTVEVTQDQQQFLAGESLPIAVRITNLSGQPLTFGTDPDWLTFEIASREGSVVPKLGDAPVVGEFVLESSKVAIKRVDLAPYFALQRAGNFLVTAIVRLKGWNRELASPPKHFDVIQGVKIWEQEVGVPRATNSAAAEPEIRRYALQQANYYRSQMRLYLRVTDFYGRLIRVFPVGPVVSFGSPERQVDRVSNLHLLFQEGASSFNYTVCNLDGQVVIHQTYDSTDSRPRLRVDDNGDIRVHGGIRRLAPSDVPSNKQDVAEGESETRFVAPILPPPPPVTPSSK
jgi:hypothetical protein